MNLQFSLPERASLFTFNFLANFVFKSSINSSIFFLPSTRRSNESSSKKKEKFLICNQSIKILKSTHKPWFASELILVDQNSTSSFGTGFNSSLDQSRFNNG